MHPWYVRPFFLSFSLLSLVVCSGFAQRPPVILIDGYHLLCESGNLNSNQDFGEMQQRLQAEDVQVTYFGTCSFQGKPSIEELGNALGSTIRALNVAQVDLVSHSMGGLIVRSYLSGKQLASGLFNPPVDPKVRKWVSIATPNFGALLPNILTSFLPDTQASELVPGNQFLFDLATWNQNHDDLRGVDTVGIIGNAGGFGPFSGGSDGTVAVTSASMSFVEPDERTRILPYCHGAGDLTSILGLGCDAPPLAKIQSDNPLSWQIVDSFLAGSDTWRTVGHSPRQDSILSKYGGTLTQRRDSVDQPIGSPQDQTFVANAPLIGGYTLIIDKPPPRISYVIPSAGPLSTLSLAPRMLISIYGIGLNSATVTVSGRTLAANYSSDTQINTLLPDDIAGLAQLTVNTPQGSQTARVLIEAAVPAAFTTDGSGTGTGASWRSGGEIAMYLTGLGVNPVTPIVTLNGVPVVVTYAGPAPFYAGVDQLNFRLPSGVSSGVVVVMIGNHLSNAVTVPAIQ
jgi:uncharacterized protein (TIGR03437 family)